MQPVGLGAEQCGRIRQGPGAFHAENERNAKRASGKILVAYLSRQIRSLVSSSNRQTATCVTDPLQNIQGRCPSLLETLDYRHYPQRGGQQEAVLTIVMSNAATPAEVRAAEVSVMSPV
ncbi:hypothetical protein WMY93_032531 [Mugilogobius chulae]|uniref:Uncharacterized protein n=1 Tax=Mugilogobius chulae TaxID=88201 RepID=A0AAW0MNC3_9GOBI